MRVNDDPAACRAKHEVAGLLSSAYDAARWLQFQGHEVSPALMPSMALEDIEPGQLRVLEVDERLVLPTNTLVRVLVTASDVLHSWAVPSLGVKMDAVPGRLNQIWLNINRPGVFYGQCSEL
eukprot:364599-Chlamydomonas_euryale.AAC.22